MGETIPNHLLFFTEAIVEDLEWERPLHDKVMVMECCMEKIKID